MNITFLKLEKRNGEIKGKKEKSIEIAKEMLKKELSVELISEITKLTIKEIEELQKK